MTNTSPVQSASTRTPLLAIVLLLAGFALRVINPGVFAAFVDEWSHINRAENIWLFQYKNPFGFSRGKLGLYYWLGFFWPEAPAWLIVSRLAIALAALGTMAAVYGIARDLFGRRAALATLTIYAFAPFTLFFERMALADPFAGMLAALTIWGSIRLARRPPTTRRTAWLWGGAVGVLAALTPIAKLTAGFIIGLPLLTIVLLAPPPPTWNRHGLGVWLATLQRRYGQAVLALIVAGVIIGGSYLAIYGIVRLHGSEVTLFPTQRVDQKPGLDTLQANLEQTARAAQKLSGRGLALLLPVLALLALLGAPRSGLIVLVWMVVLWFPILVLGVEVRTRYLVAGLPALTVLAGGGVAWLLRRAEQLGKRPLQGMQAVIALALAAWTITFALPFAWDASHNPETLDLPRLDAKEYINGMFNTWGVRDALGWVAAEGEEIDGSIPLAALLHTCGPANLYLANNVSWICRDHTGYPGNNIPDEVSEWTPLIRSLKNRPFTYFVTEHTGGVAPADDTRIWTLLATYARPQGGSPVDLWLVEQPGS